MGFFDRCFPYYVKKKFAEFLKTSSYPRGLSARFECRYCDKGFSFSFEDLSLPSVRQLRKVKTCPTCRGRLTMMAVREN